MLIVRRAAPAELDLRPSLDLLAAGASGSFVETACAWRGRLVAPRGDRFDRHEGGGWTVLVEGTARRIVAGPSGARSSAPLTAEALWADWMRRGDEALAALTSQCAVAIVNAATGEMHLFVDPFGLASLFYRVDGDDAYVCTETHPLAVVGPTQELDRSALQDVVTLRFLSAHRTLWPAVRQVVPGTCVTIAPDGRTSERVIRRYRFEPADDHALACGAVAARVLAALEAAFKTRHDEGLRDVAVFLSGGIDSSILAALAARTFERCTAFTARIQGFDNLELDRAREVAERLKIRHRVVDLGDGDVRRLLPHVLSRIQEPPRHLNSLVVARLLEEVQPDARCVVSGDAGDLLFGGADLLTVWQYARKRHAVEWLPPSVRTGLSGLLARLPPARAQSLARILTRSLDELIQQFDIIEMGLVGRRALGRLGDVGRPSADLVECHYDRSGGFLGGFQAWHLRTFLTAIYRRNSRLSEAVGAWFWYPLMEPAVVDIALVLPARLKFDPRVRESKVVLRAICAELVGKDVSRWSKIGFDSPGRVWMQGPLREWAERGIAAGSPASRLVPSRSLRALLDSADYEPLWTVLTLGEMLAAVQRGGKDARPVAGPA